MSKRDRMLKLDIRQAILDVIGERLEEGNPPDKAEVSAILIDYASHWLWKDIDCK